MESPFQKFCSLIQSLDPNDDSIVIDRNLRYLASDINEVIEGDESMLRSALEYFNERALENEDFAVNFALLFTSCHFDGLREHLQSSDGSSIFRAQILNMLQQNYSNVEKLKSMSMAHFYNSITLLGEFYNRMHQKSHPVLIIGRSLFELLAKELRIESAKCTNEPTHVFSVQFARLLLTQITLNGSLAKSHHSNEIELLYYELRKSLIEVPNLASVTKAFLLMSLDLYYNGFKCVGMEIGKLYNKYLDEHDTVENRNRRKPQQFDTNRKDGEPSMSGNSSYSLKNLKKDFDGLKTNGGQEEHRKINREYLNRPLKASDRLKYFQNSNSELTVRRYDRSDESLAASPSRINRAGGGALKGSTSEMCLSQTNSLNNNQLSAAECNDNQSTSTSSSGNRPALLAIPPQNNCKDTSTANDQPPPTEPVASPTESHDSEPLSVLEQQPSLENFNWFEAVEREERYEEQTDYTPNMSNGGGGNSRFDTMSVASYSSNPASPPHERISPQSSHTNRSRRNSLNRFRSEFYRKSTEDLQQNEKRSNRQQQNDSKQSQNYHQSWRNTGRNSPRNYGYNKRNDYDRENLNSNNNGRHIDGGGGGGGGGNYNRNNRNDRNDRNLRGGSVDSKGSTSNNKTRTRHDSFNRRNQENDNFEHFQSYNRKTYSRNKDNFMNVRTLPPRLQRQQQQQQQQLQQRSADYNNDCDNPKQRFNNRNNQGGGGGGGGGNINKAVSGRADS